MAKIAKGILELGEKALGVLDMSHDARMARAREMGFDTDRVWYHGTNRPNFDAFDPSRIRHERADAFSGAGFNFSPSQEVALKYANASSNQALDRGAVVGSIRREYPGFIGDWFESILDKGYDAAWTDDFFPKLRQLESDRPGFDINELAEIADYVEGSRSMRMPGEDEQILRALSGQKERELPHWLDESMAELGILDASPYMHQPRIEPVHLRTGKLLETADPEVAKRAELDGYDAVFYSGPETVDGVPEMCVFNPEQIRSVNAAFDPAKKDSSNLLASVAGAGVLAGTMLPSEDAEASFIGRLAKTFSEGALKKAQEMEALGFGREAIWRETGAMGHPTYKDVDGHWKQEIDDSGMAMGSLPLRDFTDFEGSVVPEMGQIRVGNAIANAPLLDAYPILKTLDLIANPNMVGKGAYTPELGTIELNKHRGSNEYEKQIEWLNRQTDPSSPDYWEKTAREAFEAGAYPSLEAALADTKELLDYDRRYAEQLRGSLWSEPEKSTLLHELQHAVQHREGFARGGSPEQFTLDSARYRFLTQDADRILAEAKYKAGRLATDPQSQLLEKAKEHFRKLDDGTLGLYDQGLMSAEDMATDYLLDIHPDYNDIYRELTTNKQLAANPMDTYKRLAGEAEARNVQTRLNMGMDQRIATPPWQTLDVPEDKLIVHGAKPAAALVGVGVLDASAEDLRNSSDWSYGGGQIGQQLMDRLSTPAHTIEALPDRSTLVSLADAIENNTQSPLGDSHFQGIVDLLRKWGYTEQAGPLDYVSAALDVAP